MVEFDVMQLMELLKYVGVSVAAAMAAYVLVRRKMHELRVAVDDLDDALMDDKVSEAEFRKLFMDFKALFARR